MYLMSYFKDAERKMFIAESDNLLEWKDLNDGKPVLQRWRQFYPGPISN